MKALRSAVVVAGALLAAVPAFAQEDYPNRTITAICGYAAGTGGDTISRYFAEKLHMLVGQPVVVEDKPGAQTALAASFVAHAKPDGYTIFITAGNSTMAANPHLFKTLSYDPVKDFVPATTIAQLPFLFTVAPNSPAKSVKELVAVLKEKGGKASYGYPNSFSQAATALFTKMTGTNPLPVAYKATPTAMTEMIGGQLDFIIMDASFGVQQAKHGTIRALAVTTADRSPVAPEYPSATEAGLSGYDLSAWWAIWLPAATPKPIVKKLETLFNQIDATDETKAFLLNIGAAPMKGNSETASAMLVKELDKWGQIIKDAGIQPE
ncbi:MAG TPA: tripartite tricarboxylate transporter substrate binding protein [Alphaproteobacteria bacterium]|nr:tripartite tricarboxylate transporter substrate binding protein [Alphaproteobacteria bacterium]